MKTIKKTTNNDEQHENTWKGDETYQTSMKNNKTHKKIQNQRQNKQNIQNNKKNEEAYGKQQTQWKIQKSIKKQQQNTAIGRSH